MTGVALAIGGCLWLPPSPKAAFLALAWLYGQPPGTAWADYEAAMAAQYEAAGSPASEAKAQVMRLEDCFAAWQEK